MEAIQAQSAVGALGKSLETQRLGADLINQTLAKGEEIQAQTPDDNAFQQSVLASQGVGRKLNISV